MSNPAPQLVQKLWNYCNMGSLAPARSGLRPSALQNPFRTFPACSSLRDDGLSYGDLASQARHKIVSQEDDVRFAHLVVEQLTFLLFLKMADDQSRPPFNKPSAVPKDYAWPSLLENSLEVITFVDTLSP